MAPVPENSDEKPSEETMEDNSLENAEIPNYVINYDSGDDDMGDEEGDVNMGYSILPQDSGDEFENEMDSEAAEPGSQLGDHQPRDGADNTLSDEAQASNDYEVPGMHAGIDYDALNLPKPTYMQVPDVPKPNKSNILWNKPREFNSTDLNKSDEDKIKSAMSGFKLPAVNIPEWASNVSEQQWKDEVLKKVHGPSQHKKDCDKHSKSDSTGS